MVVPKISARVAAGIQRESSPESVTTTGRLSISLTKAISLSKKSVFREGQSPKWEDKKGSFSTCQATMFWLSLYRLIVFLIYSKISDSLSLVSKSSLQEGK